MPCAERETWARRCPTAVGQCELIVQLATPVAFGGDSNAEQRLPRKLALRTAVGPSLVTEAAGGVEWRDILAHMTDYAWDEDMDAEGWFWLAGSEERFYGRLDHDAREGPRLHFYDVPGGGWGSGEPPLMPDSRILGELPGGVSVTLDSFNPTNWRSTGIDPITRTVDGFAQSVLVGCHLQDDEPLVADGFGASLHGLEATLTGALGEPGLLNPHGGRTVGAMAEGEWKQFELPDGAKLNFQVGESHSTGYRVTHTEVHAGLSVAVPAALEAEDIEQRYLEPVREFVIFCTRRPSYVQTLAFQLGEDYPGVKVLRRPWPYPRQPYREQYRLGLNLARVSDPDEVMHRWFVLREEVGAVWLLLFSTIGATEGLLENRFLNLMAFSEGYHRALRDAPPLTKAQARAGRRAIKRALNEEERDVRDLFLMRLAHVNSQTQRDRLIELGTQAKDLLGDDWDFEPSERSRAMVDTRNWMTHWGSRTEYVEDDPASLVNFCRHLDLISYVAILRDLKLDDAEIITAVGHGWVLDDLLR